MNKFASMNTLRNQIFLGFMVVMVIVLASVGLFTYDQVSVLLRNNAEKHIQQTAVQASGKLDALLKQIDTLTAQVATNATIQRLLTQEVEGRKISFEERQLLQQEVRKYTPYATGIQSLELFTTDYRMLLPLTDVSLDSRVSEDRITLADEGKGRLVWYGMDPRYPNVVIAIRHIRLIDKSFSHAGYLMVHMDKNYFELTESGQAEENDVRESMGLVDASGQIIASDFSKELDIGSMIEQSGETVQIDEEAYIAVQKKSEETNWRIIILTPARYATEGILILRTAIIVSVMVGGLLFLILTFILSTMITRPILNLIKAMRIAKLGTLKPIDVSTSSMEINELNNTYNQMVGSLNELIEVVYQKEIIQSRTELKALQAQINPHFLFNTLEAFYWALDEKGEEELSQVVVAMSGLFRYVIARPDEDEWVTISDELDHAERYLKIMDMRLIDRLSWRIAAGDICRRTPIPKLLIQPLVENAITHGVEQQIGPGTVEIIVLPSARTGYTRIEVTDNGPGMDTDKVQQLYAAMQIGYNRSAKGNGVGIANVDRRLKLYYESDTDGLVIRSEKGRGTTIAFEIPNEYGSES
ncbi:cache domain-containing sensor histidine kinase [Paenibacillus harenae]|uniref:cache domain-containing sensor histidine kinase n=1 Tax=Paenibacillus harenae TaxID=306543 RepID=UPI0027925281|nr:sensor histidine kinase [Paenibacillus harenae]MDQ0062686.1 two-component system sensor histidine kinase YesM [Paenibacillus harenae]